MKPTEIEHDELLKREADIARKRLLDTVDELDQRKHRLEGLQLLPVAIGAVGGVFLLATVVSHLREWSRRRHRRRALHRFLKALHLR